MNFDYIPPNHPLPPPAGRRRASRSRLMNALRRADSKASEAIRAAFRAESRTMLHGGLTAGMGTALCICALMLPPVWALPGFAAALLLTGQNCLRHVYGGKPDMSGAPPRNLARRAAFAIAGIVIGVPAGALASQALLQSAAQRFHTPEPHLITSLQLPQPAAPDALPHTPPHRIVWLHPHHRHSVRN